MPFLATASPASSRWPGAGLLSSPTTETTPVQPSIAQSSPSQPMPYPFRICSPSQIIHRMPTPCPSYSPIECHAKSPLRMVMFQDHIEPPEPPEPVWKPAQRRRDLNRSSAREALSDAFSWDSRHSQVSLLPRRRRSPVSILTSPRSSPAAEDTLAARFPSTASVRNDT